MEVLIERKDKLFQFEASSRGTILDITAIKDLAGDQAVGFRPMELVLSSLGSCMSIDVLSILYKQKQKVEAYTVKVSGERRDTQPAIFKSITIDIQVRGEVDERKLIRAIQLSNDTYCSVRHLLDPSIEVIITHQIK